MAPGVGLLSVWAGNKQGPRSPAAGAESRCVKSERVPLTGCAASAERLHLSVPQSRISEMQTKVAAETGLYAR